MKGQIVVTLVTGQKLHSAIIEDEKWEKVLSDETKTEFKEIMSGETGNLDIALPNGDWVVMPLRSVLYVKFVNEDKLF